MEPQLKAIALTVCRMRLLQFIDNSDLQRSAGRMDGNFPHFNSKSPVREKSLNQDDAYKLVLMNTR